MLVSSNFSPESVICVMHIPCFKFVISTAGMIRKSAAYGSHPKLPSPALRERGRGRWLQIN